MTDRGVSQSRIIVIDNIVTPCTLRVGGEADIAKELDSLKDADTYEPISTPPYIPKNFGQAGKYPLQLSVFMMAGLNGTSSLSSLVPFGGSKTGSFDIASERTLKQFLSLFDRAGLRLVKVHSLRTWVSIMELEKKK